MSRLKVKEQTNKKGMLTRLLLTRKSLQQENLHKICKCTCMLQISIVCI